MNTFNCQYQYILSCIMKDGHEVTNNRTGAKVKALPGITIQVDLEKEFPLLSLREVSPKTAIAEMMWFIAGEKNTNVFLNSHTKIWDAFVEDNGEVECAYGYRWRHHFGRDQLGELIRLLQKDPSSRHGVVMSWDPALDGLCGAPKKNVPCPFTFTVNIIGDRLHLHSFIRSNDMILGSPTDTAGFALLQLMLSQRLKVRPGIFTQSISNAHIYSNHYDAAQIMIRRRELFNMPPIKIPFRSFGRAEKLDESLFDDLFNLSFENYVAYPAIKGLIITV